VQRVVSVLAKKGVDRVAEQTLFHRLLDCSIRYVVICSQQACNYWMPRQ
jgi:hypothetical protein